MPPIPAPNVALNHGSEYHTVTLAVKDKTKGCRPQLCENFLIEPTQEYGNVPSMQFETGRPQQYSSCKKKKPLNAVLKVVC